ncbi:MAG TPA: DUF433 domain-containing protein [Chloroflexota bacterium]|jgi:uncharacterized protein (DUF433 family)|nr:DUF433 domain-containing protein [Chloroflexota bacterium]
MPLRVSAETPPLSPDADGVMRVARTRITLDSVVAAFQEGATAEEIAQQYPVVGLADIYAVIGYYLRHRLAIDDYLRERHDASARIRQENEARWPAAGIRERLLSRRGAAVSNTSG